MDFFTFVIWYLLCSLVLLTIITLIVWLIVKHRAIAIAKTQEQLLEKVLEDL